MIGDGGPDHFNQLSIENAVAFGHRETFNFLRPVASKHVHGLEDVPTNGGIDKDLLQLHSECQVQYSPVAYQKYHHDKAGIQIMPGCGSHQGNQKSRVPGGKTMW